MSNHAQEVMNKVMDKKKKQNMKRFRIDLSSGSCWEFETWQGQNFNARILHTYVVANTYSYQDKSTQQYPGGIAGITLIVPPMMIQSDLYLFVIYEDDTYITKTY